MLQDIPESLIEKARKILRESEEAKRPPELPITEDEKPPEQKSAPEDEKNKESKSKGEPVVFNPEIRPDVYTEPYKVQPTT